MSALGTLRGPESAEASRHRVRETRHLHTPRPLCSLARSTKHIEFSFPHWIGSACAKRLAPRRKEPLRGTRMRNKARTDALSTPLVHAQRKLLAAFLTYRRATKPPDRLSRTFQEDIHGKSAIVRLQQSAVITGSRRCSIRTTSVMRKSKNTSRIWPQRASRPATRDVTVCCLKPTVPITEPELTVISWMHRKVSAGETRAVVEERLLEHKGRLECPFLVDRACSIYPVRPVACRQFLVKSKPCAIGEDVVVTRPKDVIPLPRETVARPVAMRLLDHYQFRSAAAKRKAFDAGFIFRNARDMHEYDCTPSRRRWLTLMVRHDRSRFESLGR